MSPLATSLAALMRQGGFLVCVYAALAGCSPAQHARTPKEAVSRYVKAVSEGRLEDAYQMLSSESRAEMSYSAYKRLIAENPAEVQALLASLEQETAPPMVTALVTTRSGEELELHYEDGTWRIDESAIVLYGQSEPRETLGSFIRAYDAQRFDVLLRFVPDAQKEGLTVEILKDSWQGEQRVEMEQIVEALRPDVAAGALEVLGSNATLSYGAGSVVELTLEHGAWKVEDF